MATKAGEIELDVRLTGDDISKTLRKISDSITKKFDLAFSSLSKDFENVSTDMNQPFRALPIKAVFLKPDYRVSAQAFMPLQKLRVWTVQVL